MEKVSRIDTKEILNWSINERWQRSHSINGMKEINKWQISHSINAMKEMKEKKKWQRPHSINAIKEMKEINAKDRIV